MATQKDYEKLAEMLKKFSAKHKIPSYVIGMADGDLMIVATTGSMLTRLGLCAHIAQTIGREHQPTTEGWK